MKLKQSPDDFRVEERTDLFPAEAGRFALYRLEKRGWTTPDAVQAIRRLWHLDADRVSYGGLKDRHAHTVQHLTIWQGPKRGLHHAGIVLRYLGQVPEPFGSAHIRANHFELVLRDLSADGRTAAEREADVVGREGVPNYFDDQRFGSVAAGREFVARYMVRERYEEALRLALTAPYEYDRPPQKQEKATLRENWGDWAVCKQKLPRGHARSLVDYLVGHPADFRGALARLRPELRGLYLSAYQSDLWNRMLAAWLRQHADAANLRPVRLRLGEVPFPVGLPEGPRAELTALQLPLPSARLAWDESAPWASALREVLAEEGLELNQIRLKGMRQPFFSKGERAALCRPEGLTHEATADDRHPGRWKLRLAFELPRGCYATLIVKRVTEGAAS